MTRTYRSGRLAMKGGAGMSSVLGDGEPVAVSVETSDLDEAREVCGEHLYPRSLHLIDPPARFAARFAFLHMTRLTVADVRYGAEIGGHTGDLGNYHVNLPLAGRFAARQGRRSIPGDSNRAGVYRPIGDNTLDRSSADCHLLAVKIDTAALEKHLATLLDRPLRAGSIQLAESIDLQRDPGRSFAQLIRLVGDEIHDPTGLARHPIAAAPLEEALLIALLHAVDHQYRDLLTNPGPRGAARHVTRVIDAIQADPQRPYTLSVLAKLAGVSVRCLRREFHRQVGMSPMAYLREVRLARAHDDLVHGDAADTTVAAVAHRWGYTRPARFTQRYQNRYKITPCETLRRPYRR